MSANRPEYYDDSAKLRTVRSLVRGSIDPFGWPRNLFSVYRTNQNQILLHATEELGVSQH